MKRFRKPSALATLLAALIACGAAAASTLPEEKERLRADAVQAMIERLGLRASEQPVREMPGWKPPRKVVVRVDRPDRLAGFQAVAPGVEIVAVSTVDEAAGAAEDAQALIGFCNEEILAAGRELHWIQVYSSGVDRCVGNPGLHRGDKILTNGQRIAS
ncbi:MAG: hypothetical protein HKP03_06690, partial [Xanthomonadales bacterium]|nr:hypothetical protein [Gammaproteobacteria bacterium]NNK38151.1 hypothetical protein [Xanthomonadales bacterium]